MLHDCKVGVREKGEKFHINDQKRGLNGHERGSERERERGKETRERKRGKEREKGQRPSKTR